MEFDNLKAQGNDFFLKKKFDDALRLYTSAIENAQSCPPTPEIEKSLAILFSNRAQTNLKLESYGLAISDTTTSLTFNSTFAKSFYRRAVAKLAIRDLEGALEDVISAGKCLNQKDSKISSLEKELRSELRRIRFESAIDIKEGNIWTKIEWSGFSTIKHKFDDISYFDDSDEAQIEFKKGSFTNKQIDTGLGIEITDKDNGDIILRGLTDEFIQNMIVKFKRGWKLSNHDAFAIVCGARSIFRKEPTMVQMSMNPNHKSHEILKGCKKLTICGDTHGQFFDVLNIFEKFGNVSNEHAYLFNGDFVDRGSWSCEVALLFYALKIKYPNRIFLNRGNHETNDMNLVYGFKDECKIKYNEKLFDLFAKSFQDLPYCALVNHSGNFEIETNPDPNSYLIMHGGLPSSPMKLSDIDALDRFAPSALQPKTGPFMELLWTDPQFEPGLSPSKRGIGQQFGPDISKKFCSDNSITGILRSHEVRMGGVEWESGHEQRVGTVFSAPNYCDVQNNLGGVVHFTFTDSVELNIETFEAVWHPDLPPMSYTKNQFGF